jgi:poly(A) polymerase
VNALFYDPLKQVVIDYVGGMKDIREKRIRPIIPLGVIFKDDPVRMIRALKYAATTSFKLPWRLTWTIRRQALLLPSVSASRLTEEIMKIIHSPYAEQIIKNLDAFGLYGYLQPQAADLMKRDAAYRSRYLKSFADLVVKTESEKEESEIMAALVRDFLEKTMTWEGGVAETYKTAFLEARRFVLPMNPPRIELDRAVRLILSEHGLMVKKSRFPLLSTRRNARFEDAPLLAGEGSLEADTEAAGEPARRRRRKRRRTGSEPAEG